MKKFSLLLILLCAAVAAYGATPTTDVNLGVTLEPNTQYEVTADVTTNDAASLLALLLADGESPLQILDDEGNVLGEVPAQDLIDALTGILGSTTRQISFTLDNGADTASDVVARVLDSPPLVEVNNVTVTPLSRSNQPPIVKVTKKKRHGLKLKLRGTASDDGSVQRVEVTTNGHQRKAKGTSRWRLRVKLHEGKNRIVIRAFDDVDRAGARHRFIVRVKDRS